MIVFSPVLEKWAKIINKYGCLVSKVYEESLIRFVPYSSNRYIEYEFKKPKQKSYRVITKMPLKNCCTH